MTLHRFMLDTNALSAIVQNPMGSVARRLESRGIDRVCTSILAAAELRFGAVKSQSAKLRVRVETALSQLSVLSFDAPADRNYAAIRDHLTSTGQLIGPTDLFIAAHAVALDLTLVTANLGEFSRVPGLRVENWLE